LALLPLWCILIYVADGESKPHITLLLLDLWH
jgi:hypothetical protein